MLEGPGSNTSTADGSMRMVGFGGNGMTIARAILWPEGPNMKHAAPTFVTVKKMNLALQPCRISLDHMSQMLLYSRPYHSWAPWTDVWFCHCFLAALPPCHVQPFMDDFARWQRCSTRISRRWGMDGGWKWPSSAMRGPDSRTKFHGKKIWPTQLVCGTCNIAIGTMNNLNPEGS